MAGKVRFSAQKGGGMTELAPSRVFFLNKNKNKILAYFLNFYFVFIE